jgi:hypothetical protein
VHLWPFHGMRQPPAQSSIMKSRHVDVAHPLIHLPPPFLDARVVLLSRLLVYGLALCLLSVNKVLHHSYGPHPFTSPIFCFLIYSVIKECSKLANSPMFCHLLLSRTVIHYPRCQNCSQLVLIIVWNAWFHLFLAFSLIKAC